jgi:cation transport ATPase
MTTPKRWLLLAFLILATSSRSEAQVESLAARTKGLSCGVCGAIVELYLRGVPGVDKITMSMSKEILQVTYKAGARFRPEAIRDALHKSQVDVLQFQISARGQVQTQAGKQFFVAGPNKFLLVSSATLSNVPLDIPISIQGIVNDHSNPMELELLSINPPK